MSRKGPKGVKGPAETLKKEDVVQAVVIVDSFRQGFDPITYSIPAVCCDNYYSIILQYEAKCHNLQCCLD
jgi:hypothetical protein